ncbi:MAG TPA: choice-of-anchor Q domain-containing protein, partial [Actinomycetota bacterium]|nr:choice-of-anchor Q domain-containing protein [Actinomycetota bacterium]
VHDNVATGADLARGGGIYSHAGRLNLTASSVVRNRALADGDNSVTARGGGIYSSGPVTLVGSTVGSNRASAISSAASALASGGGVFDKAGAVKLTSSHVDGNRVLAKGMNDQYAYGGGLYDATTSPLTIAGSTLSGNSVTSIEGASGTALSRGGSIFVSVTTATVFGSKFLANRAIGTSASGLSEVRGGAVFVAATKTTVTSTRVAGSLLFAYGPMGANADGGGIFIQSGTLAVTGSSVTTGTVDARAVGPATADCGGIYQGAAELLTLSRSTLDRNHLSADSGADEANTFGAGACAGGPVTVTASTVSRNTGLAKAADAVARARAAGLYLTSSTDQGTITNSTIAGNVVTAKETGTGSIKPFGAGIDTLMSGLELTAVTVAGNKVAGTGTPSFPPSGAGIFVEGGAATLEGTILARNTAQAAEADCVGTVNSNGHNLVQKAPALCAFTKKPSDKTNVDPKLGPLQPNGGPTETMAIAATSPALDAMPAAACVVTKDQRGVHRPQGAGCDIGAYERT